MSRPLLPLARLLGWGFLCLLMGSARAQDTVDLERTFRQINEEVLQRGQGYDWHRELCETIGHRLSGSENGAKAEAYTAKIFKSLGLKVRLQSFEHTAWMRDSVQLEIVPKGSDNFVPFPAVALAHTPEKAEVLARIVDCGDGLPEDFATIADLKGAVALINIGLENKPKGTTNLHRSDKVELALQKGATGVIMINAAKGDILLTGTASVDGSIIAIPAVSISWNKGRELRQWMKESPRLMASIQMKNTVKTVKVHNVVATLKGKNRRSKVVVGAHLDSWDLAQGAIDNGLGTGVVLEMARALTALKQKPERSIEFVLFMGEEMGMHGSNAMTAQLAQAGELDQVAYMLNIDMAGHAKGFNYFGRDEYAPFYRQFSRMTRRVDPAWPAEQVSEPWLHSDQQAFMMEGIPVACPVAELPASIYDCYHANCDNFTLMRPEYNTRTARFSAMLLWMLAQTPQLPGNRMSEAQTKAWLIQKGLKEKLVLGKDWKWKD